MDKNKAVEELKRATFLDISSEYKDDPKNVRINNMQYWIGSAHISSPLNGHKGRWFTIEFFDGRLVRTCDLWYQGPIPFELRETLADNARFVEEHR